MWGEPPVAVTICKTHCDSEEAKSGGGIKILGLRVGLRERHPCESTKMIKGFLVNSTDLS